MRNRNAFTLSETMISAGIGLALLALVASAFVAIYRSITATDHMIISMNDGNRLVDYIAQDLRRAVRVGMLTGGVNTPLKNNATFVVSESNTLTIDIPDFYASNTPDNAAGSAFKTTRYSRANLNTQTAYNNQTTSSLNGTVPWDEAVTKIATRETTRFAPTTAGDGQIQIRYSRGPRSASDATVCYFRTEYPLGSNTPISSPREIAERVIVGNSTTSLTVTAPNLPVTDLFYGRMFTLETNFVPRYRSSNTSIAGTSQYVNVKLRNTRRD
ncbi:hypothetical protein ACXR0O_16000 [Verrucomicrobiota bacterium sgz303538]